MSEIREFSIIFAMKAEKASRSPSVANRQS